MAKKVNMYVNKGATHVIMEIPMEMINSKDPYVSSKGNATVMDTQRLQCEIDVDGITLPINCNLSLYSQAKNWKSFVEQRNGTKEGKKQGTNTMEIDEELFKQFLEFQKFMEASKK